MKIKNLFTLVIISILLCTLSACGCDHQWQEPSCNAPKTCTICHKTEGENLEHQWIEASCIAPKTCELCGEIKGEKVEHNFGERYCEICGIENPNYISLIDIGFQDTFRMNTWMYISAYNLTKKYVITPTLVFNVYYKNYIRSGQVSEDMCKNSSTIDENLFEKSTTTPCSVLSNDVIKYDGGVMTITDRVTNDDIKALIIKAFKEEDRWFNSEGEVWFVPADLLDFSTMEIVDDDYKIYFK